MSILAYWKAYLVLKFQRRRRSGQRQHDDRPGGRFRWRRYGPHRPQYPQSALATARKRRAISTPGYVAQPTSHHQSIKLRRSGNSTLGTTPTHPKPSVRCLTSSAVNPALMKYKADWTKARPCSDASLSFLRQLRMRQLLRRVSGQCRHQARPRQKL